MSFMSSKFQFGVLCCGWHKTAACSRRAPLYNTHVCMIIIIIIYVWVLYIVLARVGVCVRIHTQIYTIYTHTWSHLHIHSINTYTHAHIHVHFYYIVYLHTSIPTGYVKTHSSLCSGRDTNIYTRIGIRYIL